MTELKSKWLSVLSIASYAAAVFMITNDYYWPGIAFIGAGTALLSAVKHERLNNRKEKQHAEDQQ